MRWKRVICIASGPSLCLEDVQLARSTGWPLIAVNNSWEIIPECDVIYAGDWKWWERYHKSIYSPAQRWTCCREAATEFNLNYHPAAGPYNSGQRAIQFAIRQGARHILLLGYDCSLRQGIHWHGEFHMLRNPDELSIKRWKRHFEKLANEMTLTGVNIINCSRYTALNCFPQLNLAMAIVQVSKTMDSGQA
ncbi:hypothetical protein [Klebsiella aerogenes]|uniref:hypothetical protein n=1 Tax=Klebsiella aerogenes TaxID=548 RepID=UPI003D31AC51